MLKLAFICYDITVVGGVERVLTNLANDLCDTFDVYIISLNKKNSNIPYVFDKKIKISFSNEKGSRRLRTTIINNHGKLNRILIDNDIDVSLGMGHYATFVSLLNKGNAKTKIIFCDHGTLVNVVKDRVNDFMRKFNYKHSHHTVVLTNTTRSDYIRLFHAKEQKISTIYNCILNSDIIRYETVNYNSDSLKLVTVGRLNRQKGYDLLIKVAGRLNEITKKNWKWDIYGGGELENSIKEDIVNNHLEKKVVLKGESGKIRDVLGDYSIFVLTSYYEGLPLVLLEAKVNKLPMISFDIHTGPSEIIDDNINGYLISDFNIDLMAEKIKYLLENSKIRENFSRDTVVNLKKFSEKVIINEWKKLINSIVKEKW